MIEAEGIMVKRGRVGMIAIGRTLKALTLVNERVTDVKDWKTFEHEFCICAEIIQRDGPTLFGSQRYFIHTS
jgi:hypothetical protein